jgi:hypothetical protein
MTVIRNGQELEREIVALYYTLSSVPLSDTWSAKN